MNTNGIRKLMAKALPYWVRSRVPLKISQHLYFNGVFEARLYGKKLVKLRHAGHQIENEIYWRGIEGCHEKKSMQVFASIVQNLAPKVVWDIGANSGTYGILTKALKSDCEVVFFEPIPKAIEIIQSNLNINSFDAKVFEIALGNFDGAGEIFLGKGHDFATSVTVNRNTLSNLIESYSIPINVCRADTLMAEQGLKSPNLVKLDVETHEYEVLEGFGTHFPNRCIFLIEVLSEDLGLKLMDFFPRATYQFWNINDQKGVIRKVDVLGKSDFYNFLVVPKSQVVVLENLLRGIL